MVHIHELYVHVYPPLLPLSLSLPLSPTHSVTDFVQKLSSIEEQHAQQLHAVVKTFRKKTQENLKKDA